MENKLEQLLNSLVDAWWKPRWLLNEIEYIHAFDDVNQWWRVEISYGDHWYYKSLRQIASRESNLWQFVCENGYIKEIETDWLEIRNWDNPKHWIVESALCDEDKLENFLLQNIKIDVDGRW